VERCHFGDNAADACQGRLVSRLGVRVPDARRLGDDLWSGAARGIAVSGLEWRPFHKFDQAVVVRC
jgi:hypothetical protein